MPLIKSASDDARSRNISAEIRSGRPRDQAIAIAYRVQRDARRKADGGPVMTEEEMTSQMARDAAAWRLRNSVKRRFAEGGGVREVLAFRPGIIADPEWRKMNRESNVVSAAQTQRENSYQMLRDRQHGRGMADGGVAATPFYARSAARSLEHSGFIKSPVAGRTDKLPMGVGANSYVVPADVISAVGQGNSISGANAFNKLFKMGPYGASMSPPKMSSRGMMKGRKGFAEGGMAEVEMGGAESAEPVDIVAAGGEFVVPPEVVAELGGGDMQAGHDLLDAMVKQIRAKAIKTLRSLPGPKKR